MAVLNPQLEVIPRRPPRNKRLGEDFVWRIDGTWDGEPFKVGDPVPLMNRHKLANLWDRRAIAPMADIVEMPVRVDDKLLDVLRGLDQSDASLFTKSGEPKASVVKKALGRKVKADVIAEAWKQLEGEAWGQLAAPEEPAADEAPEETAGEEPDADEAPEEPAEE